MFYIFPMDSIKFYVGKIVTKNEQGEKSIWLSNKNQISETGTKYLSYNGLKYILQVAD